MTGLLTIARELRDEGKLEAFEAAWLDEIYEWFQTHLPCPPFQKNLSSGAWSRNAVAWFRSSAEIHIDRMWDIAAILQEKGVAVRFIQSANPGRIVYEDAYQIVAETPEEALI
jgi:hypothetical protein